MAGQPVVQPVASVVLDSNGIRRILSRIAHEIVERHQGVEDLALVGIRTRGLPLAQRITDAIQSFEDAETPVYELDIRPYRDDIPRPRPRPRLRPVAEGSPMEVEGKRIVLVDDVLYTGRTARAALDALTDLGRPRRVQLAVLVDRGHRELPIRADYVGKNIPTSRGETVRVRVAEVDGSDEVVLDSSLVHQRRWEGAS